MDARMFARHIALVVALSAVPSSGGAESPGEIIVHRTDGNDEQGTVLQITDSFIKLDPPGAILVRTIQAAEIESVEFVGTNRRLGFPLPDDQVPDTLRLDPRVRRAQRSDGLRPFALTFMLGRSMTGGDYYEGITSGMGFEVGGKYRFSKDNPYGSSFFIGFSYGHSSPGFDEDTFRFSNVSVIFEKARIHQYNIEFGATSGVTSNDSYLYMLTGLSIVDTRLTAYAVSSGVRTEHETIGDTNAALRLAVGGVVGITRRVGLDLRLGWDFLVTRSEQPDYGYYYYDPYRNDTDVLGNILSLDAGLVWEL